METKELYLKISQLLFNILDSDNLKFYLKKDSKFKDQFIEMINALILLESDKHKIRYKRKKVAEEYAKAIVKITKASNRFEALDENTSIDSIESKYLSLISYISKNYSVTKNNLVDESNEVDILAIFQMGNLSETFIKKKEEKLAKEAEEETKNSSETKTENKQTDFKQTNFNSQANFNNQGQPFGGFNNGVLGLPPHPIANPKFYPFKTKPKYMPILKKILSILILLSIIMYIIALIYGSSHSLSLELTGNVNEQGQSFLHVLFPQLVGNSKDISFGYNGKRVTVPNSITLLGDTMASAIIFSIFYILWFTYLSYGLWKKQTDSKSKFRVNGITLFILLFLLMYIVIWSSSYLSEELILKTRNFTQFKDLQLSYLPSGEGNGTTWINSQYANFIEAIQKDMANELKTLSSIGIVTLIVSLITMIYTVVILVVNPKKDREKFMRANVEYQKMIAASMQGQKYEMDPTLFDED